MSKSLQGQIPGVIIDTTSHVITVDRSFLNPIFFLRTNFSITEQDERSLQITHVDVREVKFINVPVHDTKNGLDGENIKLILAPGDIPLDVCTLYAFWKNDHIIPESWRYSENGKPRYLVFTGTTIKHPQGALFHLLFYWSHVMGCWKWGVRAKVP